MDKQPLTPHKIQKLIHLAEDKSFRMDEMSKRLYDENLKRLIAEKAASTNYRSPNNKCESSSGILDLEHIKGFDESGIENICLNRSSAFMPGEMTGRSTGTEEINSETVKLGAASYGSHLLNVDNLTSEADKQTTEINNILRNSIASNYSFRSNVNLTEEEASLIRREAPLPFPQNAISNLGDSAMMDISAKSVGKYFKSRCPDLKNVLGASDSPNKSMAPSITEVSVGPSSMLSIDQCKQDQSKHDQSLDCVPVRQPRNIPSEKVLEQLPIQKVNPSQHCLSDKSILVLNTGLIEKETNPTNIASDREKYISTTTANLNSNAGPPSAAIKSFIMPHKPSDILFKNMPYLKTIPEDDTSVDNSMSISKIADYLDKQSNVSITEMLRYNHKKATNKKEPLVELQINTLENKEPKEQTRVTYLIDTKKSEMASSAGSTDTVIPMDKLTISQNTSDLNVAVIIPLFDDEDTENCGKEKDRNDDKRTKSKSPSTKSTSTYSTVQEKCRSFGSNDDSPLHITQGEPNTSYAPSPNIEYKELDKSVDWHEILQQKFTKQDCLVQGQWAEIDMVSIDGFVGVRYTVNINVKTVTNNWLTAAIEFDDLTSGKDISIELPRLPLLLSPRRTEQFTLHITCNEEVNQNLTFTMHLKDAAIEKEMNQKSTIQVNIKMPPIQVLSNDGINKINFPVTQEKTCFIKSLIILSECSVDLQLDISIVEGDSIFSIKNVQEIENCDVNTILANQAYCVPNGGHSAKGKNKGMNKQLCRLRSGGAINLTVMFNAPNLSELQLTDSIVTFRGSLNVAMIGVSSVLRKVALTGTVGSANLVVDVPETKLRVGSESTNITLRNTGSAAGTWIVRYTYPNNDRHFPFKIFPSKFNIHPGSCINIKLTYTGPQDVVNDAMLIFEDTIARNKTTIEISGGMEKPKVFPIKTNFNNMSWVKTGRKELSLKNCTDSKVHIVCRIVGEGFILDSPSGETKNFLCYSFEPQECRPLGIVFNTNSSMPHTATLHLVYDKASNSSRKILLFGCAGDDPFRWSGHVTFGDTATALVRAVSRAPIEFALFNRSNTAAFICARVNFNLQYISVAAGACLSGDRHIIPAKSKHKMSLSLEWSRVEKRIRDVVAPPPLATITLLAGSEFTRRRILKVLRNESNGELDTSLLPDNLKVLAEKFEGEDVNIDRHLVDFKETKSCLNELIGGLQELTAQVRMPQDLTEENTIVVIDDTVLEHHTLYD